MFRINVRIENEFTNKFNSRNTILISFRPSSSMHIPVACALICLNTHHVALPEGRHNPNSRTWNRFRNKNWVVFMITCRKGALNFDYNPALHLCCCCCAGSPVREQRVEGAPGTASIACNIRKTTESDRHLATLNVRSPENRNYPCKERISDGQMLF